MYKIAICDDDGGYRKKLQKIIEEDGGLPVHELQFYGYGSGRELLEDAGILHDLIFADIRMPGIDGNRTVEYLREYNRNAVVVFCSNYFQPTPDSINIGQPFRYIMKDVHDAALKRELPAILAKVKQCKRKRSVTITSVGRVERILVEKILYICRAKRGCRIYMEGSGDVEEIRCKESFSDLYEQLSDKGFVYAHNSYIVNLEKAEGVEKNVVCLKNGIQLNISRSKKKQFEQALLDFLQKRSGLI